MKNLVEKLKFPATCDCCDQPATHMIKVILVCRTCLNELLECVADAIKED